MEIYFLIAIIFLIVILWIAVNNKSIERFNIDSQSFPLPNLVIQQNPQGMETCFHNKKPHCVRPGLQQLKDPKAIAKLKGTILTNSPRASDTTVAFDDLAAYNPGGIRPYNISDILISQTPATDPVVNADEFYNSYYDLWDQEQKDVREQVRDKTADILDNNATCINFKNINQCMSVCSNSPNCKSFYINSLKDGRTGQGQNTCCMLIYPPYAANRHSYNGLPDNIDQFSYRTIGKLLKRDGLVEGKMVFDHVRNDGNNRTYKVDLDRKTCKTLCPKCIMGRCPDDYRCTNMTADPRYNQACLITNNDLYDERIDRTFDGPDVPYLDARYQLNEYAGYDSNTYPLLFVPESFRYNLTDHVLPTFEDDENFFQKYDVHQVGPKTQHPVFDKSYNVKRESLNPAEVAVRGGNDPTNMSAYHRVGPYYDTNLVVPRVTSNHNHNHSRSS